MSRFLMPPPARNARRLALRLGPFSTRLAVRGLAANLLLAFCLLLVVWLGLSLGSRPIPLATILAWLRLEQVNETDSIILGSLRAPRLCLSMLSGAMLALSGALTQHVTRNGLADPGLMGVRSAAALVIVALILAWPQAPLAVRPVVGLAGGLLAGLVVSLLARGASPLKFVMIGFGISWCLSSALVILLASADIRSLQRAMIWLAGSLEGADWPAVRLALVVFVPTAIACLGLARQAELLDLGAATASALGINQTRLHVACLAIAVLLVATSVSVAGGLGFVGLVAPHMARLLPRQGLAGRLICATLIGALLVMVADLAGSIAFSPTRLPVGISLAAIGAPVLILLLWFRGNRI